MLSYVCKADTCDNYVYYRFIQCHDLGRINFLMGVKIPNENKCVVSEHPSSAVSAYFFIRGFHIEYSHNKTRCGFVKLFFKLFNHFRNIKALGFCLVCGFCSVLNINYLFLLRFSLVTGETTLSGMLN